ncbi:hypothetical protein SOM26_10515 [Sphingomonas sp. CFBP8993]|uniref:hypothetical protein n=1 Tax=Sphingomonas sp. CFBP8993 TaxID=3096526 RepID=UPI002A69E69D|nr:hypothetical protein [Sphingomonas sp. CFBP8993]MDY0959115.1 hypothetical protein [Sphingomonas sp. CFBP8993]
MILTLLAATAALTAASPRDDVVKPAAAPAAATALPTAPAAAKPTRYCFLNVEEDHIMRGKVCKTRKAWLWNGVDPLNYIGRNK